MYEDAKSRKLRSYFLIAIIITIVGLSCDSESQTLRVSAAVSLADALNELGQHFEQNQEADILFNFGGSQTLAQQIVRGAPADVFISAGHFPMDVLEKNEMIELKNKVDILSNELVVIAARGSDLSLRSFKDLTGANIETIAIADPGLAPAGRYAQEALTNLGLWDVLMDKLVFGADVRVTMTYVSSGMVDLGIVYRTDVYAVTKVDVLLAVSDEIHTPIVYPVAMLNHSSAKAKAKEFISFLKSDAALRVFAKHGFKQIIR